jgi:hypothetical protein
MMHPLLFLSVVLALLACDNMSCAAFVATSSQRSSTMTFQPARVVPGTMAARYTNNKRAAGVVVSMSDSEGKGEQETKAPVPTSGTYYDDEVRIIIYARNAG